MMSKHIILKFLSASLLTQLRNTPVLGKGLLDFLQDFHQ